MIKLIRPDKPSQLAAEEHALCEKYKSNNNIRVWDRDYIKAPLSSMGHGKCAYCETKLGSADSYPEVEHFRCKSLYPELVVNWDNLLLVCKRCNIKKGDHDIEKEPIINPVDIYPRKHLEIYFSRYYPRGDSELGKNTIDVLDLNNTERLCKLVFEIEQKICEQMNNCREQLEAHINDLGNSERTHRKACRQLVALLKEAQPTQAFSAITATTILECPDYKPLKELFIKAGMWTGELAILEQTAINIALCRSSISSLGV